MDTGRLDLNLLVALEALLAERNVTRAAARLHLSQPALSAQLARLRCLFDDQLLVPAGRGMTPTARALELQQPLRAALEGVRGAVARARPFDPRSAEVTVAIAMSDYAQVAVGLPLVRILRAEAPGMRVMLRAIDNRLVGDQLAAGKVDLALTIPDDLPPALRRAALYEERYVGIMRRDHPLGRDRIDMDRFCDMEHVIVSPRGQGFTGATDAALAASGRNRRVVLASFSFLFVAELVATTDAVALVPVRLAEHLGPRLRRFEPPVAVEGFTLGLAWHERTDGHPAFAWLRDRVGGLVGAAPGAAHLANISTAP